jgi:hypothetical protein
VWNAQNSTWYTTGLGSSGSTTPVQILGSGGSFVAAGGSTAAVWNAQNSNWYTTGLGSSGSTTPVQVAVDAIHFWSSIDFIDEWDELANWLPRGLPGKNWTTIVANSNSFNQSAVIHRDSSVGSLVIGGTTNKMSVEIQEGATLSVAEELRVDPNGRIQGTGVIFGNIANNGGEISPGMSTGVLTVAGDYSQNDESTVLIELGGLVAGSQYDQLRISDSATLDGTLDVKLIDGFSPSVGSSFEILTAGLGMSGIFENVSVPVLAGDLGWRILYGRTSVSLVVSLPGDYNGNGVIDAADYIVWRKTLGQIGDNLAADGDGDNDVDDVDFGFWRSRFGQITSSGSGGDIYSQVPEPSIWVLILAGMLPVLCRRRITESR